MAIEEKARSYGELLVHFVNAQTPVEAIHGLIDNIQRSLKWSKAIRRQAKRNFPTSSDIESNLVGVENDLALDPKISVKTRNHLGRKYNRLRKKYEEIGKMQRQLKNLLDEVINNGGSLSESSLFKEYLTEYYLCCRSIPVVENDGSLSEVPPFDEEVFTSDIDPDCQMYSNLISYFVVKFFGDPDHGKHLKNCHRCGEYFISIKLDRRTKYCPKCSRLSKKTKEERREYMAQWRAKKKKGKEIAGEDLDVEIFWKKTKAAGMSDGKADSVWKRLTGLENKEDLFGELVPSVFSEEEFESLWEWVVEESQGE